MIQFHRAGTGGMYEPHLQYKHLYIKQKVKSHDKSSGIMMGMGQMFPLRRKHHLRSSANILLYLFRLFIDGSLFHQLINGTYTLIPYTRDT